MQNKLDKLNEKRGLIIKDLRLGLTTEETLMLIESEIYEIYNQIMISEYQESLNFLDMRRMESEAEIREEFEREMRGY